MVESQLLSYKNYDYLLDQQISCYNTPKRIEVKLPMLATQTKLTFANYLVYDDGTDNRYELEDGELILINPPTGYHALIIYNLSNSLIAEINRLKLPWLALRDVGIRTSLNRSRIPDICVVTYEQILSRLNVAVVIENGAIMAVEIVSPESKTRDYRPKRTEYNTVGIPAYWIIDPVAQKVTVFLLIDGLYEGIEYQGNQPIISQTFPELELTVERILQI
jgi:Uma2 family endonuclease